MVIFKKCFQLYDVDVKKHSEYSALSVFPFTKNENG